jgi:hypothetical protein
MPEVRIVERHGRIDVVRMAKPSIDRTWKETRVRADAIEIEETRFEGGEPLTCRL